MNTILKNSLIFVMVILSITILFLLLRAFLGPKFTDRVLAINVINVKVIVLISILGFYFNESYVLDIAILYALLSFLSVIVLSRIYLDDYLKKQDRNLKEDEIQND